MVSYDRTTPQHFPNYPKCRTVIVRQVSWKINKKGIHMGLPEKLPFSHSGRISISPGESEELIRAKEALKVDPQLESQTPQNGLEAFEALDKALTQTAS